MSVSHRGQARGWGATGKGGQEALVPDDLGRGGATDLEPAGVADPSHELRKQEGLRRMAGGVAHDLNNLLTGILGNLDLLLSRSHLDECDRQRLEGMERSAARTALLAEQMLVYAGRMPLHFEAVDLSSLIADSRRELEELVPPQVRLELAIAPGIDLRGDPRYLRRVLRELVINAAEAIEAEVGAIMLVTGRCRAGDSGFCFSRYTDRDPSAEYAFIEVRDSGSGMDAATLECAFDPFFSTKLTGRGLGLACVSGILRAHEGGLEAQSRVGEGTRVRLLLPLGG